MNGHQIDFSLGSVVRKYIQNEFASDKWSKFKTWFFDTYSAEDLHNISQEFYETCALHNHIMFYVPWFITTYLPLFINVLERSYKDESGNIIQVIYPPQAPFILPNNAGITFTAFQKFIENDVATISINEINNLISQNNYLGLYVKVLGEHISSLDNKLDDLMTLIVQIKNEIENTFDFENQVNLEINKLHGYPKKNNGNTKYDNKPNMQTYFYSRPTPQNVLIEKRDWNQTNTSYSGSEIYEWNLDGLIDRQLTIVVHRMLMYATNCKSVNNTDRTICKMIIAAAVINAKAINEGVDNLGFALVKNREDVVYILVLTILEHFNGRFTNQYEIVRSLLNGLRCRHLGEFRWYKDTYLSRVMELPENGLEHWKTKFIDGLPPLFAERVRKTLRNQLGVIPYGTFTYGKLIGACTQEGINLCNELKLSRQLKIDKLRERSQMGDFCTQFGLPDSGKQTKHRDSSHSTPDETSRKKRSKRRSSDLNLLGPHHLPPRISIAGEANSC
ncbi:hypothetical protein H5410_057460 [Solanum commersonii]|uniref:Uncharacterized protein n=1 Tax=Solanum commersonii TaxID=4109 RepID=A0A9J5WQX0_SOLCO|nr:hypothetical protein H5410_057460 [Solanum commersonii]